MTYLNSRLPLPKAPTEMPEIRPLLAGNHLIRLDRVEI